MVKSAKTFDGLLSKMNAYCEKRPIFRGYRKDPRNAIFYAITQAYPEACGWHSNLFYKYEERYYIHNEGIWNYPEGLSPRDWIDKFVGGKLIRIRDSNIRYFGIDLEDASDLQIMDIFTQTSLSPDYEKTKTIALIRLVDIVSERTGIAAKEIKEVATPNAKMIIAIAEDM